MTLERLTIHNLASIADASIDFLSPPLADDPIFLITGPTGAGKTTLLDAISLALFGRTPRMERVPTKEKYDVDKSLTSQQLYISDNRQLMRRGTGECHAELIFHTDGGRYQARWHVHRSRQKTDGKLLSAEHTLENLSTGEMTKKQTVQHIEQLLNTTYEQFCRTSVLAQGEFTKFLQSSSNDKSDILEKLTGTAIYSRIGQKIFEMTQERISALGLIKARLEAVQLLSDEQRQSITDEIEGKQQEAATLAKEREALTVVLEWKKKYDDLQRSLSEVSTKLSLLTSQLSSYEYTLEERDIADYQQTTEPRLWMAERNSYNSQLTALNSQQTTFDKRLAQLLSDLDNLELGIGQMQQLLAEKEASIPQLQKTLQETEEKLTANAEETKSLQTAIDAKEAELQHIGPTEIQNRIRQLTQLRSDISTANGAIEQLKSKREAALKTESRMIEQGLRRKKADEDIAKDKELCEAAQKDFQRWQAAYDKTSLSVKDWAREARLHLQPGDSCPVCGQEVKECLSDEHFISLLAPIEHSLHESNERLLQAQAQLKADQKTKDDAKKQEQNYEKQLAKDTQAINEQLATARKTIEIVLQQEEDQKALPCLTSDLSPLTSHLAAMLSTAEAELAQLYKKQEEATAIQNEIKQLQKQKDSLVKNATKLNNEKTQNNKAIAELNTQIINTRNQISTLKSQTSTLKSQISNATGELGANASERLNNRSFQRSERLRVGELCSGMALAPNAFERLSNAWHQLNSDIIKWKQTIESLQSQKKDREQKIETFCGNGEITLDRLTQLSAMPKATIEAIANRHDRSRQQLAELQGQHKQLYTQIEQHLRNKPEAQPDDIDTGTMSAQIDSYKQQEATLQQSLGALRHQLEADAKSHTEQAALIRERDEQQQDCDRWSRLNTIFGSKEGQKFRSIAQGFILGHLIEKANAYLRHFTDRYALTSLPGSLVILVSDSHHPGRPQAATILSGGETFMVSLSLALALASLNSHGASLTLDTLFIDEGFGTLDGNCLQQVMDTLERLHQMGGRRVGIISHVEELKDRITTKIVVTRNGSSPSEVKVATS